MQGMNVLKEGVIWRVGNGQQINIWRDTWVPHGVTRQPVTPRGRNLIQHVDELIDPGTETWDLQLLSQTFREEDVKVIHTIPVHVDMDDIIAWHFDAKGCFTVKSAYRVHRDALKRSNLNGKAEGAKNSEGRGDFWKRLWQLDCMPKVKHFLWRLHHNTLAFRKILQRKGMKIDSRCCMCGRFDEDGGTSCLSASKSKKYGGTELRGGQM